mmetsp:Transcript_14501/g.43946  ORF Transcript_14501/g.43946 Transcript_14501/m.43946 type:complete len:343 (-) Transcript_14501:1067-2095(-)
MTWHVSCRWAGGTTCWARARRSTWSACSASAAPRRKSLLCGSFARSGDDRPSSRPRTSCRGARSTGLGSRVASFCWRPSSSPEARASSSSPRARGARRKSRWANCCRTREQTGRAKTSPSTRGSRRSRLRRSSRRCGASTVIWRFAATKRPRRPSSRTAARVFCVLVRPSSSTTARSSPRSSGTRRCWTPSSPSRLSWSAAARAASSCCAWSTVGASPTPPSPSAAASSSTSASPTRPSSASTTTVCASASSPPSTSCPTLLFSEKTTTAAAATSLESSSTRPPLSPCCEKECARCRRKVLLRSRGRRPPTFRGAPRRRSGVSLRARRRSLSPRRNCAPPRW